VSDYLATFPLIILSHTPLAYRGISLWSEDNATKLWLRSDIKAEDANVENFLRNFVKKLAIDVHKAGESLFLDPWLFSATRPHDELAPPVIFAVSQSNGGGKALNAQLDEHPEIPNNIKVSGKDRVSYTPSLYTDYHQSTIHEWSQQQVADGQQLLGRLTDQTDVTHRLITEWLALSNCCFPVKTAALFACPLSLLVAQRADEPLQKVPPEILGMFWLTLATGRDWSDDDLVQAKKLLRAIWLALISSQFGRQHEIARQQVRQKADEEHRRRQAIIFDNIREDLNELLAESSRVGQHALRIQAEIDITRQSFLKLFDPLHLLFLDRAEVHYKCDDELVLSSSPKAGQSLLRMQSAHSGATLKNTETNAYRSILLKAADVYNQSAWLDELANIFTDDTYRAFEFLKIVIQRPHMELHRLYEHQACFALRLATVDRGEIEICGKNSEETEYSFGVENRKMSIATWLKDTSGWKRQPGWNALKSETKALAKISEATTCVAVLGAIMQLASEELKAREDGGRTRWATLKSAVVQSHDDRLAIILSCDGLLPPEALRLEERSGGRGLRSCLLTLCRAVNQLQPVTLELASTNVPAFEVIVNNGAQPRTQFILRLPREVEPSDIRGSEGA
jgi:hypothetical protein